MDLKKISLKNNKNMQEFCMLKINEIASQEVLYMTWRQDRAYICDYKELDYKLGRLKLERDYYNYFLYLLQVDYANLNKAENVNITQLTI